MNKLTTALCLLFSAGLILGGCGAAERGAIIYLLQHNVLGTIVYATIGAEEDGDDKLAGKLRVLEDELQVACSSLQKVGFTQFEGEEVHGSLKSEAYWSFDGCESMALRIEGDLRKLIPEKELVILK